MSHVALPSETFEEIEIDLSNEPYLRFFKDKGIETTKIVAKGTPWKVISPSEADELDDVTKSTFVFCVRDSADLFLFTGTLQHVSISIDNGSVELQDKTTIIVVDDLGGEEVKIPITKGEYRALFVHRVQLPDQLAPLNEPAASIGSKSNIVFLMPSWFTELCSQYFQNETRLHVLTNARRFDAGAALRTLTFNSSRLYVKEDSCKLIFFVHPYTTTCICGQSSIHDSQGGDEPSRGSVAVTLSFCGGVCDHNSCSSGCRVDHETFLDPQVQSICQRDMRCEVTCCRQKQGVNPFKKGFKRRICVSNRRTPGVIATVSRALELALADDEVDAQHCHELLSTAMQFDESKTCEEITEDDMLERDQTALEMLCDSSFEVKSVSGDPWKRRFAKRSKTSNAKKRRLETAVLSTHGHLFAC